MDRYKVTLVWEMTKTVYVDVENGNYILAGETAIRNSDSRNGEYVEDSMSAPFVDYQGEVHDGFLMFREAE